MLRLVRDDAVKLEDSLDEDFDDLEHMQEPEMQAEGTEESAEMHMPAESSDEPSDGAIEAADDGEGTEAAALPPINFGILEALLLSTHHPLTAGRLAELL